MTAPRRLLEDQAHALARRTLEQRCRLTPGPEVNAVLRYLVLRECAEHAESLEVTAYCALSNHHHFVITDLVGGEDSKLSDFFRDLHAVSAKALNTLHGCSGVVWDPGRSFSQVEIHGFEAEIAQWVYVAGQAVAAGIVERPEDWPGVCWLPEDVGTVLTARRPDVLFSTATVEDDDYEDESLREAQARLRERLAKASARDKKRNRPRRRRKQLAKERRRRGEAALPPKAKPRSDLPERVSYRVPVPKCLRGWKLEDVRRYLRHALDLYVAQVHEERRSRGVGFLGPEALAGQNPHAPPPGTKVATAAPATYQSIPTLATRGLDQDAVRALKDDLSQFHQDYGEALELLLSDTPHRTRFPQGAHLRAQEQRRVLAAYRAQAPPRAA